LECFLFVHSNFLDNSDQHARIIVRSAVNTNQVACHEAPFIE
jgi:hypothetical protein